MNKVSLKELLPQESELTLNKKTYHLRPVNANDWAWMEQKWGDPSMKLQGMTILELCTILFRLIKEKEDFLPIEKDGYNDDGYPLKITMTAPMRLAEAIEGFNAISEATEAFQKALGVNDLTEEDIEDLQESALKKNRKQRRKSKTAQKSST